MRTRLIASFNISNYLQLQIYLTNGIRARWYFSASIGVYWEPSIQCLSSQSQYSCLQLSLVLWTLSTMDCSTVTFRYVISLGFSVVLWFFLAIAFQSPSTVLFSSSCLLSNPTNHLTTFASLLAFLPVFYSDSGRKLMVRPLWPWTSSVPSNVNDS